MKKFQIVCILCLGAVIYAQSPTQLALDFSIDKQYMRELFESTLAKIGQSHILVDYENTGQAPYLINASIKPEQVRCNVTVELFDVERSLTLFSESMYSSYDPTVLYQTIQELTDKAVNSLISSLKADDIKENEELKEQIANLRAHNQELLNRLVEFTQWGEDLGGRVNTLKEQNRNLADRVATLDQDNQDLGNRVAALDQYNQNLANRASALDQYNQNLTNRVAALDQDKQDLADRASALEQDNRDLVATVAALNKQNQELYEVTSSLEANFVRIPSGDFFMGSQRSETSRDSDEVQRKITIDAFYIGKAEVTQKEWTLVMGSNPSHFKGENLPVENISWFDAVEYCNKRSLKEGLTPAYTIDKTKGSVTWNKEADGYRLPTEAEWEYACRAGTTTAFYTGGALHTDQANFDGMKAYNGVKSGYKERSTDVKTYDPNPWGLFDMHGNVWEWCWDWYNDYNVGPQYNPDGAKTGVNRVMRGGGWNFYAQYLRSANRGSNLPSYRNYDLGLRLARP